VKEIQCELNEVREVTGKDARSNWKRYEIQMKETIEARDVIKLQELCKNQVKEV
jgi:hypothetical protein